MKRNSRKIMTVFLAAIMSVAAITNIVSSYNRPSVTNVSFDEDIQSAVSDDDAILSNAQVSMDQLRQQWVDSVMQTLTPRQRIAQLFVPRWDITDNAAGVALMRKQVVAEGVGGFLLGKGTVKSYANLINEAQSMARVPLMVTLDGEWGLSMRVDGTPRFPHNMALGAIADTALLREYGAELARECRLMGIQVDFAPVLDVNSNPANPVIGYRSFGEDPKRVAAHGAAFCRGMEHGGIMSVGKHFPGHGDTSVDSHKALPTVDHTLDLINTVDLVPFVEAQKAGMSGVMVGHLRVPSLDKTGTPASLSKVVTTDLLRKKMGFKGLVFTDALAMKGAVTTGENNCVSALRAGADILLGSGAPLDDIQAVVQAVKKGVINQLTIDERCRRVLAAKYDLGLNDKPQKVDVANVGKQISSAEALALMDKLAKASITVVRNNDGLLPLGKLDSRTIAVVSIGAPADNEFARECRKYADVQTYCVTSAVYVPKVLPLAMKADVVIAALFKNESWCKSVYAQMFNSKRLVSVSFLNPYKSAGFKQLGSSQGLVLAYDDIPALRFAAAQAIFGGIDVNGRVPVNVPGLAKIGDGLDLKKKD